MTNLTTAALLHYLPRGTTYTVLNHNLLIKVGDSWEEGCLYTSTDVLTGLTSQKGYKCTNVDSPSKLFVRPYKAFNMDKWEVLEQESPHTEE